MKKSLLLALIIVAIVIACVVGSYAFAFGVILLKLVFGLSVVVIFTLGVLVGRFFPYKSKKQILHG